MDTPFDLDWRRFTGLHVVSVASIITLLGLIAIGFGGGTNWFYWIALAANVAVSLLRGVFVSYPRRDGTWRGIGDKPN